MKPESEVIRSKIKINRDEKILRSIVDSVTPVIMKRYKLKINLNNPELDKITRLELKKEYLRLVSRKDIEKAEILLKFIQGNPRFIIGVESPWKVIAKMGTDSYDYSLYPDDSSKRIAVNWMLLGRETPENRKKACEFYGIDFFSEDRF